MSRPVLIALIGFAAAAAALGLAMSLDSEGDPRSSSAPALTPVPIALPEPVLVPAFDVIRIGERGDAVLAGRATPRADVALLDGERELGRVAADERGEWVFVPTEPLPPGARALAVEAHNPDGTTTRSAKPVILVVPVSTDEPALAVARLPDGGARLMAGPGGDAGPLSVDLVDRDEDGVFLGGRTQAGALVQLYVDNAFLGRAKADAQGGWRLAAKSAQGRTLRADLVDDKGKVLARLEVPLTDAVAAPDSVAVQPGQSQWTIARRLDGERAGSTTVYRPDRGNFRDPEKVYPGQVFGK